MAELCLRRSEMYNLGHLPTAARVHHRVTGRTNLFHVARTAADFLDKSFSGAAGSRAQLSLPITPPCPPEIRLSQVSMYPSAIAPPFSMPEIQRLPYSRNTIHLLRSSKREGAMPGIGQTVSHYRIIEKLGGGEMGVVHEAEDSILHRHVAIKALPDEFAHDAERVAHFQREAQMLASLNHPNITMLHGLEDSVGKRLIAMELVEGQTLAHRLLRGRLPVDEAVGVCRQITEGLEAAHEIGVIHRK